MATDADQNPIVFAFHFFIIFFFSGVTVTKTNRFWIKKLDYGYDRTEGNVITERNILDYMKRGIRGKVRGVEKILLRFINTMT